MRTAGTDGSAWGAINFQAKARFLLHERFKLSLQSGSTRFKNAAGRAGGGLSGRPGRLNLPLEVADTSLHLALACYQEITRGHW